MMMRAFAAILLVPLLVLSGCLSAYQAPAPTLSGCNEFLDYIRDDPRGVFRDYRDRLTPDVNIDARVFRTTPPGKPIIVRYSDSGELSNRCDYSAALYGAMYQDPNIPDARESNLIVVYVHGWRNDSGSPQKVFYNFADYETEDGERPFADQAITREDAMGDNYAYFTRFVEDLRIRTNEAAAPGRRKNVVGVFVSWKAGTRVPIADHLSFWDRSQAADKIARSGALPRLFGALESVRKPEDQIVFIGHSFGGRILYNSVEDRLIHDTQLAYEGDGSYEKIERNKDLIFLINPAFEAAVYKSVDEFRYENRFGADQPPLLVTVTSEADWPNQLMFPAGQVVARQVSSSERRSVGFWDDFVTHSLCMEGEDCFPQEALGEQAYWYDNVCDAGVCLWRTELVDAKLERQRAAYRARLEAQGEEVPTRRLFGDPRPSPFLVVRTPGEIINGHGWFREGLLSDGPANGKFSDWMVDFITEHNCRMSEANVCGLTSADPDAP